MLSDVIMEKNNFAHIKHQQIRAVYHNSERSIGRNDMKMSKASKS
jgi:hypothetical protein